MGLDCCALITLEGGDIIRVGLDGQFVFQDLFYDDEIHSEFKSGTVGDYADWAEHRLWHLGICSNIDVTGLKKSHKHYINKILNEIERIEYGEINGVVEMIEIVDEEDERYSLGYVNN